MVVAMGNEYRRDDGAGAAVMRAVAPGLRALSSSEIDAFGVGPLADPLDLLGQWDDAALAVVVDAVRTGAKPGTVVVLDLGGTGDPGTAEIIHRLPSSTHGVGLAGALRLARAVGRAPHRVLAVGIEGEDFGNGDGLSDAVAGAIDEAADRVLEIVGTELQCA